MRRRRRNVIIAQPTKSRSELEALHGRLWTLREIAREFVILSRIGHTVVVRRKDDDTVGTLAYQEGPPFVYFNFKQQSGGDS